MKYSIITCTYNAEKHLKQFFVCIEAIRYKDFEVVIVDDASKDNTYETLISYAEKSSVCVKVYHHEYNQGPGVARNLALSQAIGEKIIFVDVDDKISPMCMVEFDAYDEYDIVFFDYYKVYENGKKKRCSSLNGNRKKIKNVEYALQGTSGCVWGKVFDGKIIRENDIKFPALYKSEDLVFIMKYLCQCSKLFYLDEALYYYMISQNSLMHRNVENQIGYARSAMEILQKELQNYKGAYAIIYNKEIIYDITNIYMSLGRSKKDLYDFWGKEPFSWSFVQNREYYTIIQLITLCLIKMKYYVLLKLLYKLR